MTKQVKLSAQSRGEKSKPNQIRQNGFIPVVVYGAKSQNRNLQVKKNDFIKTFELAGEFNLVDLLIDDKETIKVIIKDVQKDGVRDNIIHADLYAVDMNQKITTQIPLNFIGESKAVKELGGTLVKNMDTLEVSCLPGDLVSHIDVDLSGLVEFDQFIRMNDLKLSKGIELDSDTNEAIVGVTETKVEEEAPVAAPAAEAAQEATKEEKTEETAENKK